MGNFTFISKAKKLHLFLNTSFLFLLLFYISTNIPNQSRVSSTISTHHLIIPETKSDGCTGVHEFSDYESQCTYVKLNPSCRSKGYINYLEIFYCRCGRLPGLGYAVLLLFLALLFYLLGNTAAEYFCPSLESLSSLLKLSPTIAGTTLLPLGNGATDVFASIVSFTRSGDGDVGLNSVLGGAFFVSSMVVGIISILISSRQIEVDKPSFIRDVLFFLFSLLSLLLIITVGRIYLWVAICFTSIYFVYICVVSAMHFFYNKERRVVNASAACGQDESGEMSIPLLGCVDEEKPVLVEKDSLGDFDQKQKIRFFNLEISGHCLALFLYIMELPLYLPRRLTIPVVSEEKWSKSFAVISVSLAPILLAALWNTQKEDIEYKTSLVIYMTSVLTGMVFGNFAFVATKNSRPPKKCLFPWLAGGFLMSITWTYIIAEELVSLLVSLGNIFAVSPSVLGLTVLAWGNSVGDLIANVALSTNGGPDGAQIAISGCFAGPLFNTLMGLGLSLVFASWSEYPSPYVIPADTSLYETIGFLMGGLLWALVILPNKNMRLDRFLGCGLLSIYFCFLFLRLARALGLLRLHGSNLLNPQELLLSL